MSIEYKTISRKMRIASNMRKMDDIESGFISHDRGSNRYHKRRLAHAARQCGSRVAKLKMSIEALKP